METCVNRWGFMKLFFTPGSGLILYDWVRERTKNTETKTKTKWYNNDNLISINNFRQYYYRVS